MSKSNLDLARERFAGAGNPMPDDGAVMQQEFEDAIITLVLCWYDSQETDSPQEVSVLRYHIRQVIAADRELRQQADPELAHLHENGAKAWADVPDATAWVDELRGSESQSTGNVMSINYMDESGKPWRYCSKCHAHSPAEIGCAHFAAAPVAVERQPLTDEQDRALCEAFCNTASDAFFEARPELDTPQARRIFYGGHRRAWIEYEAAHGITAQQGGGT